jgi:hypothetical protein
MESPPFVTAFLGYALGAAGDRASATAELADLEKRSPDGKVLPFNMALVHLGLGERARTIDDLEQALAADSRGSVETPSSTRSVPSHASSPC